MAKRFLHLVSGLVLLGMAGYCLLAVARGWKPFWRHEWARTGVVRRTGKAGGAGEQGAGGLPGAGPAGVSVYGLLAGGGGAGRGNAASGAAGGVAAQKAAPKAKVPASQLEHVALNAQAPIHFLHERFSVRTYKGVEFVVPRLALHPRLEGKFRAYGATGAGQEASGPAVEIMLMTEAAFRTFERNETETTEASAEAAEHGEIDWALDATYGNPQKYYLVFRNASDGDGVTVVDADFTVKF